MLACSKVGFVLRSMRRTEEEGSRAEGGAGHVLGPGRLPHARTHSKSAWDGTTSARTLTQVHRWLMVCNFSRRVTVLSWG